ncbi:hypothetical protein [Sporomusa sphaeroides]|uniref:Uncharacterized protein n=1 Tax=Sporomusa sphaeroides DSM 2875 TaxID=1337886 RepID=A0A1U7M9V4_9FIRM|nr:hypothetical protein [Sporomusa sphaeroides]OLS54293.1 hypothetical protein SPSPH_45390 [Sporomusa sphaeroides DSM 2875]CVK21673.1 hypothetical protein SSPH_04368 [Sporomusa sphaeroides DSM 2875]
MKAKERRLLIGMVIAGSVILVYYYASLFNEKPPVHNKPVNTVSKQVATQKEVRAAPVNHEDIVVNEFPSPFSNLPEASTSVNLDILQGSLPKITTKIPFNFPEGSMTDQGQALTANIQIVGLIPAANGKGQAILSNGSEQLIVDENSDSKWGFISDISKQGVTLNGNFVSVNGQSTAQKFGLSPIRPKIPAIIQ